jgi:hypothetical protein
VRLSCPKEPGTCDGTIALFRRRGGVRLARSFFSIPAGEQRAVSLVLGPRARAMLNRSRRVGGEVRVSTRDVQAGRPHVEAWKVSVRG